MTRNASAAGSHIHFTCTKTAVERTFAKLAVVRFKCGPARRKLRECGACSRRRLSRRYDDRPRFRQLRRRERARNEACDHAPQALVRSSRAFASVWLKRV